MGFSAGKLRTYISKMLLLAMSCAFFIAQFSYCSVAYSQPIIYEHSGSEYTSVVKGADNTFFKSTNHTKITKKLNKNFQPESTEPLSYVHFEPELQHNSGLIVSAYRDYLFISLILSLALRGPPVVG